MTATGDRKLVTFGIVTTVVAILMVFAINVRRGQLDGEIPTNGRESHIFDDIYDDVLGILADASDAALPSSAAASTKARSKGSKARSKSVRKRAAPAPAPHITIRADVDVRGYPNGRPLHPPDPEHRLLCDNQADGVVYSRGRQENEGPFVSGVLGTHASNLVETPEGEILMVNFYGEEGGKNVTIAFTKLDTQRKRWAPAQIVSADHERSAQNPVLIYDPEQRKARIFHT